MCIIFSINNMSPASVKDWQNKRAVKSSVESCPVFQRIINFITLYFGSSHYPEIRRPLTKFLVIISLYGRDTDPIAKRLVSSVGVAIHQQRGCSLKAAETRCRPPPLSKTCSDRCRSLRSVYNTQLPVSMDTLRSYNKSSNFIYVINGLGQRL